MFHIWGPCHFDKSRSEHSLPPCQGTQTIRETHMHTHTHMHTPIIHIIVHTPAHMQTYTHAQYACTHAHTHTLMHTHHTPSHTTHTHHTHTHPCIHTTHAHTRSQILKEFGCVEDFTIVDCRLFLCTLACSFSLIALAYDYLYPFPASCYVLATCAIRYPFMMALTV